MTVQWIALDWGTSHLRAWAMSDDGNIIDHKSSAKGMGTLDRADFEPALVDLIGDWLTDTAIPVLACGMVGARQGWIEAPYRAAPCTPFAPPFISPPVRDPRMSVVILPGVSQNDPADVMRGEETQIAGFVAAQPEFEGFVCLPGTHAKWAEITKGEIRGFTTFMTGELFALLAQHSILRHSLDRSGDWDAPSFLLGVETAISEPARFAAQLFTLRAQGLLSGLSPAAARARLSGLLIGTELAAMRMAWQDRPVAIIGARSLAGNYHTALTHVGADPSLHDGDEMVLKGLGAARAMMSKVST